MPLSRMVLHLALLMDSGSAADPAGPLADAALPEHISGPIHRLNDDDFEQRERAVDDLFAIGLPAVTALRDAAEFGTAEASVRAFDVLQQLYRGNDEPTFEAVDLAFQHLSRVENLAVTARAERAFESGVETRQNRAIAQFERLGGIIHVTDRSPERRQLGRPRIEYVMLGRDWSGGDEGLRLLERIDDIRNTVTSLYIIRGVDVPLETVRNLQVELPLLAIHYRGPARLGIRSRAAQQQDGCIVDEVDPGSAAERAGLRNNDQVMEIDGQSVDSFEALIDVIKEKQPGDKVPIVFRRGSETHKVVAELTSWAKTEAANPPLKP